MDTMKALVKAKSEAGIWLEDVPVPEVGINDVLIRIHKTAICGTDVHIYNWDEWAQRTIPVPMHVGHEFVGTVAEIGRDVHDFKPGDLVTGEGHLVCGRCRNCLAGRRHVLLPNIFLSPSPTSGFVIPKFQWMSLPALTPLAMRPILHFLLMSLVRMF